MRHHQDCDVYQATMGREIQDMFGLHGDEELIDPDDYTCHCDNEVTVKAIIDRARTLTDDEALKLSAAWDALAWHPAWEDAQDAAYNAARGASRHLALHRAWNDVRGAVPVSAWDALWDTLSATMTRDLIDPEQYEMLMTPWRAATENA